MTKSPMFCVAVAGAFLTISLATYGARADADTPLVDACLHQMELTASVCDCISQSADAKLSQTQQDYVVAQLNGDQDASDKLEGEMTDTEVFDVGDWMDNAPAKCEYQ